MGRTNNKKEGEKKITILPHIKAYATFVFVNQRGIEVIKQPFTYGENIPLPYWKIAYGFCYTLIKFWANTTGASAEHLNLQIKQLVKELGNMKMIPIVEEESDGQNGN